MPAAIYYFSATGNSLFIAKDLARQLGAQLLPISHCLEKGTTPDFDTVGIV